MIVGLFKWSKYYRQVWLFYQYYSQSDMFTSTTVNLTYNESRIHLGRSLMWSLMLDVFMKKYFGLNSGYLFQKDGTTTKYLRDDPYM